MLNRYGTGINVNDLIQEQCKEYFKTYSNSLYGQALYADTDSIYTKENNKMKDFMVLHDDIEDGRTMILRKSAVVSVRTDMCGGVVCCYVRTENCCYRVTESYAEVVKRLFE